MMEKTLFVDPSGESKENVSHTCVFAFSHSGILQG
jgi:hypothetical protein